MSANPVIQETEKVFLKKLLELIENETVSPTDGQAVAKEFLHWVDIGSLEQFKSGLHQLTTAHADFKPVYSEFLKLQEQEQVDSVLNKMQTLMGNSSDGTLPVSQSNGTQAS